ncbi:hypothetical protein L1987_10894 [Smallanthus sonchifolius]|uniref:Uncharacterized protein n=1 Tax=Smallanthus sonchifolius TaxID=185202 RepID=A0ACB9JBH0_9ASTR|nr:hypothetical protein L1987_10894 [Smallanthus sonchifolius]
MEIKESTMADAIAPLLKRTLSNIDNCSSLLAVAGMADAIAPDLRRILSRIDDYNSLCADLLSREARDCKGRVIKYSKDLMDHLRSMMQGYENEEAMVLLNKMEREVDRLDCLHFSIPHRISYGIFGNCEKLLDIRYGSNVEGEETVVGFDDEVETLLDQLTATCAKQLQVSQLQEWPGLFGEFLQKGQPFDRERYQSLRILDVESVPISLFPSDVIQLDEH